MQCLPAVAGLRDDAGCRSSISSSAASAPSTIAWSSAITTRIPGALATGLRRSCRYRSQPGKPHREAVPENFSRSTEPPSASIRSRMPRKPWPSARRRHGHRPALPARTRRQFAGDVCGTCGRPRGARRSSPPHAARSPECFHAPCRAAPARAGTPRRCPPCAASRWRARTPSRCVSSRSFEDRASALPRGPAARCSRLRRSRRARVPRPAVRVSSRPASSDFSVMSDSVWPTHVVQIARDALALGDLGQRQVTQAHAHGPADNRPC